MSRKSARKSPTSRNARREAIAAKRAQMPALSPKEQETLEAAATGHSVIETAADRHRSQNTIDSQRAGAVHKLEAKNINHAIFIAGALGLLDDVGLELDTGGFDDDPPPGRTPAYDHEAVAALVRAGDVQGAREATRKGGSAWGGRSRAEGRP